MMQKCNEWVHSLCFLIGILILIGNPIYAQQRTIQGTVKSTSGEPVIGATVSVKGTTTGSITDADGKFSMNVPEKSTSLIVSFIGMETLEVRATGQFMNVVLQEKVTSLDEVIAIGYGNAKRGDVTGSITSVSEKELKDIPVASALQAISGRMAGVNVTISEGSPDADIRIRVRGGSSITQDNSPLFIVDGFQVSSIKDIPPGDIESIVALKDASSTAIYGAKGANGVILVTTKSGKSGKSEVSFNTYHGIKKVYNLTDVLSPYEYVYYQRELDPGTSLTSTAFFGMYGSWDDIDIYKSREGTDWQKKLYGNTGVQRNYNVSMSGGDKSLKYNLSYTRDDENYIMLNSAYLRDNLSIKLNKTLSPVLDFDFTARMTNSVIDGPSVSSGKKLRDATKYAPVYSLTHMTENALGDSEDKTSAEALSALNDPVYNTINEYKKQKSFQNTYNAGLSWKIMNGLTYRVQGSFGFIMNHTDNIWLNKTGQASSNGGQPVAQRNDSKGNRWSIQNTLTYDFDFLDNIHKVKILLGQELYNSQSSNMLSQSKFYPKDFTADDVLAMWNYGTALPTYTTIGEPSRTESFFGRINYSVLDRYILTLNTRADATNVFAPKNRWGIFPGAAFAWRFSNESFMAATKSWLTDAKLRLSYGSVGNANVGNYWRQNFSFLTAANQLYYPNDAVVSALVTSSVLKNENLTWETKISSNIGLDLSMFDQRLNVTVEAYKDVMKDLILSVALPSSSGYSTQFQNMGGTSNRGVEITVMGDIIDTHDFQLSANFNISFNRNRVEELDGGEYLSASSGWGVLLGSDDYRAIVGQPVGLMYGYVSDGMYTFDDFTYNEASKKWVLKEGVVDCSGVFSTSGSYFGPGHQKLKKLNGEGTKVNANDDRQVIGNAQPKHTGGFGLNASYKGFDLSATFNWSYGNDIYNANKIDNTAFAGSKRYQNISTLMDLEQRFTTIDPVTGNNIMFGTFADPVKLQEINQNKSIWHPITNTTVVSDWAIEDGSFLRLNNLTLGYTLPRSISQRAMIQKLRVYATAYNLMCWTKYSGQDPEVSTRSATLTPGLDYSAYPKARNFLFGVNVTF